MRLDPATGWCHGVRHCPSVNFNERPTGEISLLVIHNISLPPGSSAPARFRNSSRIVLMSQSTRILPGSPICAFRRIS